MIVRIKRFQLKIKRLKAFGSILLFERMCVSDFAVMLLLDSRVTFSEGCNCKYFYALHFLKQWK